MTKGLKEASFAFKVKKKHTWRGTVIRVIEISLILLVVLGTGVWLLVGSNFSFSRFFQQISSSLKPKVASDQATKNLPASGRLKLLIQEKSLFEISNLTVTAEGDFQVQAKSGQIFVFSAQKDLSEQVATLQTLLSKAKIENKSFKKVDFRFDKIVVEY